MTNPQELTKIGLFARLSDHELSMLSATLNERTYSQDDVLFSKDDPALSCFVILQGQVGVYLKNESPGQQPVAVLGSGETVGHLALVDRQKRSAKCVVFEHNTRLAELRVDDFERLFNAQTSFAYKILDNLVLDLVMRLRNTNETLLKAAVAQKNQIDGQTRKVLANQLLGQSPVEDEWDPDKVELMGMSLEHRIKRKD